MSEQRVIYKITFLGHDTIYEIYAKHVGESSMYGFLEVEELLFGENTSLVVDPSEEKLKTEFQGVKRTYIPMHTVLRIDEMSKEGVSKLRDVTSKDKSSVTQFPTSIYKNKPERSEV